MQGSNVADLEGRQEPEVVRAASKLRLRGQLAHPALWTETEGGGLKSLGLFQPSVTQKGLSTGFLIDLKVSKPLLFLPACPVHRPPRCEWRMFLTALAWCRGNFHCSEAVVYSGMPFVPHRGKGVPLQPCCQQPGLHRWPCHPPGPHFLSNR